MTKRTNELQNYVINPFWKVANNYQISKCLVGMTKDPMCRFADQRIRADYPA